MTSSAPTTEHRPEARGPGDPGPFLAVPHTWSDHLTTAVSPHRRRMALKPVARSLVPEDVFDQLLAEVVDGELAAGDPLPSERRLAEVLGVSRPAVREALQRLSQARLVEVRHGGSTTVRDFRGYAGLDLLPRLLVRDGALDAAVARSILRGAAGHRTRRRGAGRRARRRRGPRRPLTRPSTAARAAEAPRRGSTRRCFWDAVVDAADSIVFRLMFNSLRPAYEPAIEALGPVMDAEVDSVGGYRRWPTPIAAGDPRHRPRRRRRLLRPATDLGLLAALDPTARHHTGGEHDDQTSPEIEAQAASGWPPTRRRITGPSPACAQYASRSARSRGVLAAPLAVVIGGFLRRPGLRRGAVVGERFRVDELIVPVGAGRALPGDRVGDPRRDPALAPAHASGRSPVDSLLARKHRAHHADPRDLPLVFIPWQVAGLAAAVVRRGRLLAFPATAAGAQLLVSVYALMFGYEWTHYLVHSDYRPHSRCVPRRCGATTGCTTTRTSTTGSPSPRRAPPTGCSAPIPTAADGADLRNRPQPALAGGEQALSRTAQLLR